MDLFTLKLSWKHTEKIFTGLTFPRVELLLNSYLIEFEDTPDPKIKIEIFREYE